MQQFCGQIWRKKIGAFSAAGLYCRYRMGSANVRELA